MPRRQWLSFAAAVSCTLTAGLLTRPAHHFLPRDVTDAAGDALWSLLVYLLLVLVRPRWSARRLFTSALVFSFAIEFSQLYHAPFIDAVRRTTLGGLILGWGFAWTDLLCYTVGCAVGGVIDHALRSRTARPIE